MNCDWVLGNTHTGLGRGEVVSGRSSFSQGADNQVRLEVYQRTVLMAWEEHPDQTSWHTNNTCYCVWPSRSVGRFCLWWQVESAHSKPSSLLSFTLLSLSSLSPVSCGIDLRSQHLGNWHSLTKIKFQRHFQGVLLAWVGVCPDPVSLGSFLAASPLLPLS